MRFPRLALPAALAATALALSTFATPAFADDPGTTTLGSFPGEVAFESAVLGNITLDYTCAASDPPEVVAPTLDVDLTQRLDNGFQWASAAGSVPAICDGTLHSTPVALGLSEGEGVLAGWAFLNVSLGSAARSSDVTVIRTDLVVPTPDPTPTQPPAPAPAPAPAKATVTLTTNASPESVVKGKKITVKGTVKKNGKKFKAKTQLQFAPDSTGTYKKVKSVTSSKSGKLSTTLKATTSGAFRYVYAGSSKTKAATSAGDHIVVKAKPKPKPKPKAYKNCTALTKVYPHGVGKSGAHDKGGSVTSFTRDNKTYAKNTKSDRDKDGIACER